MVAVQNTSDGDREGVANTLSYAIDRASRGRPMSFTRNPASIAGPSPSATRNLRQKRLAFAASLRRACRSILRLATDAPQPHPPWYWPDYVRALAITGVTTAIAFPLSPYFGLVNTVMLYLLGTTVGALRLGRGPSVLLAIAPQQRRSPALDVECTGERTPSSPTQPSRWVDAWCNRRPRSPWSTRREPGSPAQAGRVEWCRSAGCIQ
jgi:hypothetical protein